MAGEEILLGIITLADNTRYFIASSTYIGDVTPIGGGEPVSTIFYGDIPGDKKIAWSKQMGFFVWGRQSKQSVGDLWLFNESLTEQGKGPGRYDDLLLNQSRDATIEYFIVNDGDDFSTASEKGVWLIDSVKNPDENHIVISVVDKLAKLDKNTTHEYFDKSLPFTENRLQPRPIFVGYCNQVPIPLVDDANNRFEMHQESTVSNVVSVSDSADPFSYPADYSKGVLAATGGYGVDLTNPFTGVVTLNGVGALQGGVATSLYLRFARYLLEDIGGLDVSDIDTTSLANINTGWSFMQYGVYIPSGQSIREIIEHSMVGHCGYVYQKNNGDIYFDWVKKPDVTADHVLDEINIESQGIRIKLDRAAGLSDTAWSRRNWHVFTYEEIKDVGISENLKKQASSEYVYKYTSSVTTGGGDVFHDTYEHARNGEPIRTLNTKSDDHEKLIDHLEDLYDVERHFYEFERLSPSASEALDYELGETMELNDPRFFPSGKNTLVTKIEGEDMLSNIVGFETWG